MRTEREAGLARLETPVEASPDVQTFPAADVAVYVVWLLCGLTITRGIILDVVLLIAIAVFADNKQSNCLHYIYIMIIITKLEFGRLLQN